MLMTVCQTTGLHTAGKLEVIILYIDTESGPFVELSTLATCIGEVYDLYLQRNSLYGDKSLETDKSSLPNS